MDDGLPHLVGAILHHEVAHRLAVVAHDAVPELTRVPMLSPSNARAMLPGVVMSNTMIGSSLSMQNVIAVESITFSPRLRISKWLTSVSFTALGSRRGSAL